MRTPFREIFAQIIWRIMHKEVTVFKPKESISMSKKIRFHPKLTWGEKVFLAELLSINPGEGLRLQPLRLGKVFGVSHVTIGNWVKKLVDNGLAEIQTSDYFSGETYIKAKTDQNKS